MFLVYSMYDSMNKIHQKVGKESNQFLFHRPILYNMILDRLLDLGFELNYVLMDREFYRAELLDEIKGMGGNVLIPAKQYKKVKKLIEDYLNGKGNRARGILGDH